MRHPVLKMNLSRNYKNCQLLLITVVKRIFLVRNVYIQAIFLNSIYIFSCNYSPLNSPDETVVKVKFMDGKLESSVVLPKGLYHVYFK